MARTARRTVFLAVLLALCFVPEILPSQPTSVGGTTIPRSDSVFHVGWYDRLDHYASFQSMQAEGTNEVVLYGLGTGMRPYLAEAASAGSSVFVQINPAFVKAADVTNVTTFVNAFKDLPGVRGWYLSDEPTLDDKMTPATGELLYNAIKAADPVHPVAIAFNATENAEAFANAMDVVLWDDYPVFAGTQEFHNLSGWRSALAAQSAAWRNRKSFVPIIQAFGSDGTKYTAYRLPTPGEARYMVYAALQTGVDGLFFWAHFVSDPTWRSTVFTPLMTQVNGLLPAVEAGRRSGATATSGVGVALFRDPATRRFVLIAVNNGATTVRSTIHLPKIVQSKWHTAQKTFAPYGVRIFRF